jgi:hypothetical protein
MRDMIKEQFLRDVEEFLRLSGMAPTTFGYRVMGDYSFVTRLRDEKKGVTVATVEHVRSWMKLNEHLLKAEPQRIAAE